MIGKTVSHYKVLEKLGEGGMGVVYKAEDTKLERLVALKFLPAHVSDEATKRFINEAHAAAALNHPHICTIHEIDEHHGQSFIAMEFIEGHSLKDRIQKGPLAINDFLSIATQIAEGLREAHEKGIVHRDIKPGNIMLTPRGQVKILDFGLARLGARARITKTDKTVGTVAYMSPEQAIGIEVDRRSDIWSLGVMFYEILTGRLPFQADYDQAVVYAILNLDPEPISSFRQGVPLELEQLIDKALAKNREDRFEDVEDMLSNLQAIEGQLASASDTGRTRSKKSTSSIAVLPFANLSADPEQEYFCDGLAEEIINALGRLENLRVVARTSAFSFKEKAIDIREIGSKLNVATLLEGSVRKAGNRLRISVQLINVTDGYHLWSERYDREMEDIFAIQDEISLAIVDNLKLKVLRDERAKLVKRQTENPDAHNLYLMGRYFWNKRTKADIRRSVDHFQKAVEIDPTYALAYSGMAEAYVTMGIYGCLPFEEISTKAKEAAATAIKLDSTLSQAHASLAMIKIWIDWDCAGAEREFRLALNLNPADAEAHHQYGHLLAQLGRFEEAVAEMKYALELEPLSLNINACLGQVLFLARRYDGSIEQLQKTIEMNPGYYDGHGWLAMAYLLKGYYQKAIAKFKEASAFGEIKARMTAGLAYTYAVTGEENMARDILARMKDESRGTEIEPYLIATVYAGLGDVDRTIEYLNKAYETRSHRLFTMLKVCPLLDVVRSDPRYKDLLQKLGLE